MTQQEISVDERVDHALAEWSEAIKSHDEESLERIHDDEFTCIELGGTFMDKATHIAMELQAKDVEMNFHDVRNREMGDVIITWARQTLRGIVPGHEFNDPNLSTAAAEGVEFVFTLVWRKTAEGLRVHTFHASSI